MKDERQSVLDFIENTTVLPNRVSVETSRYQHSQYLLHLLIRFYRKKTDLRPVFCEFGENTERQLKGTFEEHSILDGTGRLFVITGADASFLSRLRLPKGTYVVASAANGQLKAERYRSGERRNILKCLLTVLGMKMSLRALLDGDWSGMTDYGDFERVLRKARAAGWTEEQTVQSLSNRQKIPFLLGIKRGKFDEIFRAIQQRGEQDVYRSLLETIALVIRLKLLKQMGYDDERCLREMDLQRWRMRDISDESTALTTEELEVFCTELVKRERTYLRNPLLGMNLICLGSKTRLTR